MKAIIGNAFSAEVISVNALSDLFEGSLFSATILVIVLSRPLQDDQAGAFMYKVTRLHIMSQAWGHRYRSRVKSRGTCLCYRSLNRLNSICPNSPV